MRLLAVVIGLVVLVALGGLLGSSGWSSAPPSAKALEAMLLAPCCFGGTLDVHDSEISRELRAEIESRVAGGESTVSVEADLVSRYGPQMRAMPNLSAFSTTVAMVMAAIGAAGIAVLVPVRRWRGGEGVVVHDGRRPSRAPERDADDARLDAELEALD